MRRAGAAVAVVAVLAGCGGAARPHVRTVRPRLPRALAQAWEQQAAGVEAALAAGDGCTAQQRAVALRAGVIEAVNAGRISPRFQETLLAAVNDLASRITCTPAPAPAPPPAPRPPGHGPGKEHGPGHGHGHGHGHGGDGGDG